MAKNKKLKGIYQLSNGYYGFRYSVTVNGTKKAGRRSEDETGNPLKTEKQAIKAKEKYLEKIKVGLIHSTTYPTQRIQRKTIEEVYNEYCEKGRNDKAYSTIKKQDSLWKNHLRDKFGSRKINSVSVAEINDYLTELYYVEDRAYSYTESFLKMFYLIFGQAYSRNYMDVDTYNKLCINKDTKIHMPKKKLDEDDEIVTFTKKEIEILTDYFKDSNAETAYLLGRYCGLRINECYGLKWSDIDLNLGTIHINKQMQYQDGVIKLVVPKTRNAIRTIYMSEKLRKYLQEKAIERENNTIPQQQQIYLEDIDHRMISSIELINCLPNGKIQTNNSMKYHAQKIKERFGFKFKYHYLRHTYGTLLASMNTPSYILCNQMGHASSKVTEKYYLAVNKIGIEKLQENLNRM